MMRVSLLLAAVPLVACTPSSNDRAVAAPGGVTRSYQIADFSGIDLRGADDVDVRVGTGFSVRAEGPVAELDKLAIARNGDMLRIERKHQGLLSWGHSDAVKVYVTMPRIIAATLSGSGNVAIDRVEGERFRSDSSGSGDIAIGAIDVEAASFAIAGAGNVAVKGTARQLDIRIAGSGDVDAAGLKANKASVTVAGSGNVRAVVDGPADVSATGSGDVDLGKAAHCTTQQVGSGSVRCG